MICILNGRTICLIGYVDDGSIQIIVVPYRLHHGFKVRVLEDILMLVDCGHHVFKNMFSGQIGGQRGLEVILENAA